MLAPFLAAWVISPPPTPRTLGDGALELRLPESAEGCGQPLPQLRRGDAVVSIYDYGDGALAPRFRRAASVRAGRMRYAGRSLSVFVTYGGRRRPASAVQAVRRLLASATVDRA